MVCSHPVFMFFTIWELDLPVYGAKLAPHLIALLTVGQVGTQPLRQPWRSSCLRVCTPGSHEERGMRAALVFLRPQTELGLSLVFGRGVRLPLLLKEHAQSGLGCCANGSPRPRGEGTARCVQLRTQERRWAVRQPASSLGLLSLPPYPLSSSLFVYSCSFNRSLNLHQA